MSTKPCGQKEARNEAEQNRHRAAADLAGARRSSPEPGEEFVGDFQSLEGIRVRVRPRGKMSEGGRLAGPSRSSQTRSGGLTGGPRLSAQPF
jgi:hypothetical protein